MNDNFNLNRYRQVDYDGYNRSALLSIIESLRIENNLLREFISKHQSAINKSIEENKNETNLL
jgi:hypothetical protein